VSQSPDFAQRSLRRVAWAAVRLMSRSPPIRYPPGNHGIEMPVPGIWAVTNNERKYLAWTAQIPRSTWAMRGEEHQQHRQDQQHDREAQGGEQSGQRSERQGHGGSGRSYGLEKVEKGGLLARDQGIRSVNLMNQVSSVRGTIAASIRVPLFAPSKIKR